MAEEKETEIPPVVARDPVYLGYYAQLQHQQNMLQDVVRTMTYQQAIFYHGADRLYGKTVLDVGSGSGILSFFAAQAGAETVYAVEASDMADKCRKLLENVGRPSALFQDSCMQARTNAKNHVLGEHVRVIKGKIEDVVLPVDRVDAIISEPIGVFLVHERMLESYIEARDRYLRPGGLMLPCSGTIHVTPFTDAALWSEMLNRSKFWASDSFYDIDLSPLFKDAFDENMGMPIVGIFPPEFVALARDTSTHVVDFYTVTQRELVEFEIPLAWRIDRTGVIHGLAGWFDLDFLGDKVASTPIGMMAPAKLDTSPYARVTHWQQVRFLLREPLAVNAGQSVVGTMKLKANEGRSYDITASIHIDVPAEGADAGGPPAWARRDGAWGLQDQIYYSSPVMPSSVGTDALDVGGAGGAAALGMDVDASGLNLADYALYGHPPQ